MEEENNIKPDDLNSLFDECELQKLKEDFANNSLDNYLMNSWEVVYYIVLKKENGKVFTRFLEYWS